jgi:hypothetical protein
MKIKFLLIAAFSSLSMGAVQAQDLIGDHKDITQAYNGCTYFIPLDGDHQKATFDKIADELNYEGNVIVDEVTKEAFFYISPTISSVGSESCKPNIIDKITKLAKTGNVKYYQKINLHKLNDESFGKTLSISNANKTNAREGVISCRIIFPLDKEENNDGYAENLVGFIDVLEEQGITVVHSEIITYNKTDVEIIEGNSKPNDKGAVISYFEKEACDKMNGLQSLLQFLPPVEQVEKIESFEAQIKAFFNADNGRGGEK